jgi:hypothetical protein
MQRQDSGRHSGGETKARARRAAFPTHRGTATQRGDAGSVRAALVPQLAPFGILAIATTAAAGGAKGVVAPPPDATLVPIYLLMAVSFLVVAICLWFVSSVFTDRRFTKADPRARVKLAREALAPILEILGLLQKAPAKPAPAS